MCVLLVCFFWLRRRVCLILLYQFHTGIANLFDAVCSTLWPLQMYDFAACGRFFYLYLLVDSLAQF
jgi:hypothetical protein